MITKDALDNFISSTVATSSGALQNAVVSSNFNGDVSQENKFIRTLIGAGEFSLSSDTKNEEQNVKAAIHFFVKPEQDTVQSLDNAIDLSFEMAKELYKAMAVNDHLNGGICRSNFREFLVDEADFLATTYGATFLFGEMNY